MTVPEAKVKDLEKDKKYGNYSAETYLNDVNGLGITFDDNSNINSKMLNGEAGNSIGIDSNNDKAADDLAAEMVANSKNRNFATSRELNMNSQQKKDRAWQKSVEQQRGFNRNVNSTVDAMYRNPSFSNEERLGQERMSAEEKQRIKANEKPLDLLDKQIQQQGQMGASVPVTQIRTTAARPANSKVKGESYYGVEAYQGPVVGASGREGVIPFMDSMDAS